MNLVAAARRLDEFRVGRVVRQQSLAISGKAEEVVLLLDPCQRRVGVVGASSTRFLDFFLGLERFTARAVVAGVDPLVQIPRVVDGLDKLAASDMVPLFTGLDEVVVRNVECPPDVLELSSHFVDVLLGFHAQLSARWGTLMVFSSLPIKR